MCAVEVIKVGLVEDTPEYRNALRAFIDREEGLQVVFNTGDPTAAASLVDQHRPQVLILDYSMPQMTGLEVMHEVRGVVDAMSTKIIMLTVQDDVGILQSALEGRVNGFLTKGQPPKKIIESIREVMQSSPDHP
ncbi:MAG: response regulator transcription factor, partial [Bacteroidota bacterium]